MKLPKLVLLIGTALFGFQISAVAQNSPAEIRAMLGMPPVDVIEAAVFSARREAYTRTCGKAPEFEGHGTLISRLEFGSLDPLDRDRYVDLMKRQFDADMAAQTVVLLDDWCRGLNAAINRHAAAFIRSRPHLFKN